MTDLCCLSLDQPWASLVAIGVKTIETRSWPTKHRGRIGIASTVKRPKGGALGRVFRTTNDRRQQGFCLLRPGQVIQADPVDEENFPLLLPLGAIVATANIVDCVPIVEWGTDPQRDHITVGKDGGLRAWHFVPESLPLAWQALDPAKRASAGGSNEDDRTDQLPYGDFTPGRWAWLLDDVRPTTERCPACWGDGYEPTDVERRLSCQLCSGAGVCDPIPVKGKQRLWRWTP